MSEKKNFRKRQTRRKPQWQIDIANERIEILFNLAKTEFKNNRHDLAKRYVGLARKIGMKYNISLSNYKMQFCKMCGNYLAPGINSKIKIISKQKIRVLTCLDCMYESRYGYE
ncbi:MAG: ribonuclease P [Candidatus Aenigmarchaeota archaeon]|nr:ribonuclease P [Candidatus Aenigmarchaeota archaeon]